MKRFRGITLVELLVAMAVFSIIMVGVMNIIQPVQTNATNAKVMNYQQTNEETVVTYIGEQLRYANNILIAEQGSQYQRNGETSKVTIDSPKDAVNAFIYDMGIANEYGEILKPYAKKPNASDLSNPSGYYKNHDFGGKVKANYHMIIWDGRKTTDMGYTVNQSDKRFYGRMFFNTPDRRISSGSEGLGSIGSPTGKRFDDTSYANATNELYFGFGKGYFGTSDMYLQMNLNDEGLLKISCESDYYANASKLKAWEHKSNDNAVIPTVGYFQLRNWTNKHIKMMTSQTSNLNTAPDKRTKTGVSSDRGNGRIIYILYTTDEDIKAIMNEGEPSYNAAKPFPWGYDLILSAKNAPIASLDANNGNNPNTDVIEYWTDGSGKEYVLTQ